MALHVSNASEGSINLAPNPSFEEGTLSPTKWVSHSDSGGVSFIWDDSTSHSGQHSLAISNFTAASTSGYWKTEEQIYINPSHDYLISAWYRNTTTMPWVAFLTIVWGEDDPLALGSTGLWQMVPTDDWIYRSRVIPASDWKGFFAGANRINLSFGAYNNGDEPDSGTVWIDDVSFVDLAILRAKGLRMNYNSGSVGSYFNIHGSNFPPNRMGSIDINGENLGVVAIDEAGTFSFTLSSDNANNGDYFQYLRRTFELMRKTEQIV